MKTFIVLCLYDAMLNGEEVSRATFCAQHNISERTFYRYINEIGKFLMRCKSKYVISANTNDSVDNTDSIYRFIIV